MNSKRDKIFSAINSLEFIPPLPKVAERARAVLTDGKSARKELKKLVYIDPAFALSVVQYADRYHSNSSQGIRGIDHALNILELDELVELSNKFGDSTPPKSWHHLTQFDGPWRHALSTAFLAKSLQTRKAMVSSEAPDMYLAGLLHHIGWVVLDFLFPELLQAVIKSSNEIGEWSLELERELIGCDHQELGGYFLKNNGIDSSIVTLVENHHSPHRAGKLSSYAALLQISTALAPCPFPVDIPLDRVDPNLPHRLKSTQGRLALNEMKNRYSDHLNSSLAMVNLMTSWL